MSLPRVRHAAWPAALIAAAFAFAHVDESYVVPLDHPAVGYATRPVDDPVSRLQKRLDRGEVKLDFGDQHGYLAAILKALSVPQESQVLVFSKTSFQAPRIAPRLPRAIYFNDSVSVGWVRGGDVLEFAAVDPRQGVIFYTLDQEETARPRFDRRDTCLQCHATGATLGVPGLAVRSVYPQSNGMPIFPAPAYITDHRSPLKERWGGWYVSGRHGSQRHMGNAVVPNREQPTELETGNTQNQMNLKARFDTGAYLTPHSDIVALMMLEHQTRLTNLIARLGFEARMGMHDWKPIADEVASYMTCTGEAMWTEPLEGVSGFAERFAQSGPRDRRGRSLRDLDLDTRLLRYSFSYLIYSEAFDALPPAALDRVYRKLWELLRQRPAQRQAVVSILRETKPTLPAYWQ